MRQNWFVKEFTKQNGKKFYRIYQSRYSGIDGQRIPEPVFAFASKTFNSSIAARLAVREAEMNTIVSSRTVLED